MKKQSVSPKLFQSFLMIMFLFCSYKSMAQDKTVTEIAFDHDAYMETFAYGADISWLSQQESWGTYYCDRNGKKADLMDILKNDFGINALRFRVWVNPSGGWSGKNDVIGLCKRAHAKGFKIMISFHYSDTWADSQNQTIPAQWTDHSAEALAKNVYDHTRDVLSGLKAVGITPKWVSIGNETKYGMLYDTGRTKTTEGVKNFVKFINAGAKAVKEIDPDIITIIHLSNGHDEGTARSMFDNLEKYGANYDCLGFSCYPKWSHLDLTTDANVKTAVNTYLNVFKNLKQRFKKPVMVMETGHYGTAPYDGNRFFAEFIKSLINDKELGCFYWEPEAFDNSGYNLGAWSSVTHQGTIAMDAFKGVKHTKVNKYAIALILQPNDNSIYFPSDNVEVKINAKPSNTVTSISTVDLYVDKKLYKSMDFVNNTSNYIFNLEAMSKGAHTIYALVNDNQGHSESTDTIHILMDNATMFQENGMGFEGISDGELKISKKVQRYTGDGYIPGADNRLSKIYWNAYFPEPGRYVMYIRYHADDKNSMYVHIGDKPLVMSAAASPEGRWAYVSKEFDMDVAGLYKISLNGLSKGYPDIDFMAISPVDEGGKLVSYTDDVSAINNPCSKVDNSGEFVVYDIHGRMRNVNEQLRPGFYIRNGRKFVVR